MAGSRIKGQEVSLIVIVNGAPQTIVTAINSIEFSFQLEIISKGYCGETTERKDSIFKGVRGQIEFDVENQSIFPLIEAIVDKARRRAAGTIVNVKGSFNFPNGRRPMLVIPEVEFGEIPLNFGSRDDYGAATLEFEAQEARAILG